MPNRLGPLEVNCDAPPYNIVRACHMIGFRNPEDVRWSRLRRSAKANAGRGEDLKHLSWRALLGMNQPGNGCCVCGQPLPVLEKYTFTLISGNQTSYMLGQCRRCSSIYWDQG